MMAEKISRPKILQGQGWSPSYMLQRLIRTYHHFSVEHPWTGRTGTGEQHFAHFFDWLEARRHPPGREEGGLKRP